MAANHPAHHRRPPSGGRLADWVTFSPNQFYPIYNWFYYKEGFSRDLVFFLVEKYGLKGPLLDPFGGSGTTALAAREMGLEGISFDVSPVPLLAARAKTHAYDLTALQAQFEQLKGRSFSTDTRHIDVRIRKLFFAESLVEVMGIYRVVNGLEDKKLRDFFTLAIVDTAARVAHVDKVGGSLRKRKKPRLPVTKLFLGKCTKMLIDLKKTRLEGPEPRILQADARQMPLENESVGAIVTSPPYLNKIEYTKVYKLELGLFFDYSETQLRSFISDNVKGDAAFSQYPPVAQAYFSDMKKVLAEMHRVLVPGGIAAINVAGGCFPDRVVQADEEFILLGKEIGFELKDNLFCRPIHCMADRTTKVGMARETIVVMQKKSARSSTRSTAVPPTSIFWPIATAVSLTAPKTCSPSCSWFAAAKSAKFTGTTSNTTSKFLPPRPKTSSTDRVPSEPISMKPAANSTSVPPAHSTKASNASPTSWPS